MAPMRDRPTADVIVLVLTGVVGFVIVIVSLIAVVAVITGDASSITTVFKAVGQLTNGLISLIVGYIAGRGVGGNGNGNGRKPPDHQD